MASTAASESETAPKIWASVPNEEGPKRRDGELVFLEELLGPAAERTMRTDAATQHDELWIVEQRNRAQCLQEQAGGRGEQLGRPRVTSFSQIEDVGRAQLEQQLLTGPAALPLEALLPLRLDAVAAKTTLQWSRLPHPHWTPRRSRDREIADLARRPVCPVTERAAKKMPAPTPVPIATK